MSSFVVIFVDMKMLIFLSVAYFCQPDNTGQPIMRMQQKDPYKLVWSDEFNKDGRPDPANWTFEEGFVRNHEAQWYQPENAWCENGRLVIEARKADLPSPVHEAGSNDWRKQRDRIQYTSSCLITRGLREFKFGRFEMRARFDIDTGLWPAWWTLGVEKAWPGNGEIDIMEYYKRKVLANIACKGLGGRAEWFSKTVPVDSLGGTKWSKEFHTWRMDWDEEKISFYLDDRLMNSVPLTKLVNKDGSVFEPFKQPHYILLDLALGGDNGGDLANTAFPRRFEVDYVRVYQKDYKKSN